MFNPEWRLYARSASDDKAPIVAMLGALDALKASGTLPAWNVKIILDGDEESGSTGLLAVLPNIRQRLAADLMLVFDGPSHASGRPTVTLGVRGLLGFELTENFRSP